ncbi:hypothetical protein [Amphritea japonica]|uniref:Peptidase S1 domain-containing protein n=1 Tax=Amphritea japonica ATCC BAA-1530 TaxID=1278309 RepID=A0A7R6ST31_9GAMM|nr:hypothetical protein [Amphritea japonica]BBB26984.1 conserved hypothetical protein [Amphritea japonica ATCC BAA-1530]
MIKLKYCFVVVLMLVASSSFAEYPDMQAGDTRQIRGSGSPDWLAAVGRSISNKSATVAEGCSWSLVTDDLKKDGVIILGAGHCVDHWVKGDGSFDVGPNSVSWVTNSGKKVSRKIESILKAETHQGDYAIARIDRSVSRFDIKPLINAPYDYTDLMDPDMFDPDAFATMAGYSADTGIGQKGKVLTYDRCRQVNGGASGMKKAYCYSYEGASGGPLVVTLNLKKSFPGQTEDEDVLWYFEDDLPGISYGIYHFFVGTIVGARAGDDASKTLFTETTHYSRMLDKVLKEH